ncbi:MAG: EamA family transporter [Coriobacteriales bacterium]|nr:EamA family transporter [Coriobacteriales bacterium]
MNLAVERTKYIVSVVLYGTIGMFLRYVSIPSEIVAMCRGALGSVFILLYLRMRRKHLDRFAIRENLKWLVIAGVSLGLNWIFLFASYMQTTVAIASLCNYMAPIIVILIAPVVLKEQLDKRKMPYVVTAFVGIILVSGVWNGSVGSISGVVMALVAAICFVIIIICNRKIHDIPALYKSVIQLAISAVTILPYVLVRNWGATLEWDMQSILIILMLGMIHTGVAYCLYFSGMGSLPVQTVAILGYLEPVVSVLCSAFFLHEAMGVAGWIGAVLIIGAAIMSEIQPTQKQKE